MKFQMCFQECSKKVFRKLQGHFKGVYRNFQGCFKEVSRVFQRSYSEERYKSVQVRLKGISRSFEGVSRILKFKRCVREVSMVFQRWFKEVFNKFQFQEIFKGIPRKFQGCFKDD